MLAHNVCKGLRKHLGAIQSLLRHSSSHSDHGQLEKNALCVHARASENGHPELYLKQVPEFFSGHDMFSSNTVHHSMSNNLVEAVYAAARVRMTITLANGTGSNAMIPVSF